MHRALVLFPSTVEASDVERFVREEMLPAFGPVPGFLDVTVSVGPLMGPSARSGQVGRILTVDFESLEAALEAIQSDRFAAGYAESDRMGAQIYLFETAPA